MVNFIIRYSRRYKISRLTEILLKLFYWPRIKRHNTTWVEKAKTFLELIHNDVETSCICNNQIVADKKYDLQIIIPVYNVERYLEDCLDSVFSQDKGSYNILVVIVNDGSPDRSSQILEKYRNHDDILIINQNNKGLSGARNSGLNIIYSDYIMFVDSDDALPPNCLKKMIDVAKLTDADTVQGSFEQFSDSGICKTVEIEALMGFSWGKIYKSSLFEQLHFPEKYWFEDTFNHFLIHGYISTSKIEFIHDIVYRYRINPNGISKTSRGNPKILDTLYITNTVLSDIKTLKRSFDTVHERLLFQVITNYYRIASLKSEKINRAVFAYTCDMYNKYYKNNTTDLNNEILSRLKTALEQYDYKEYLLVMLTY